MIMKRFVSYSLALLVVLAGISVFGEEQKGKATKVSPDKPKKEAGEAGKTAPIRNKDNKFVTLETTMGKMTLELYHDVAPAHADSFLSLTHKGFYDGLKFHRVIDHFMIQGGDPKGDGSGGADYNLKAEFSKLPHLEGTLSAARTNDPNSASSQFFICLAPAPHLDGAYTIFGQLIHGYDVLHKIGSTKVGPADKPVTDMVITKAYQSDDKGTPIK
jgi:peptidyl-prolyl cis-trans isomerase B (cyclophilin B)